MNKDITYDEGSGGYVNQGFEEKVKSMTAKEIILAMVESLTPPPTVNVDMSTFGRVEVIKKKFLWVILMGTERKCFGCAATNTICRIANISPFEFLKPPTEYADNSIYLSGAMARANNLGANSMFLTLFECAIDSLRSGDITRYNTNAEKGKFALIVNHEDVSLAYLDDDYDQNDLNTYIELANKQP